MRILTVRQPWAWAIVHGGKDVENRVRNVAGGYRGPVAIHAALAVSDITDTFDSQVARAVGRKSRAKEKAGMGLVPSRVGEPDDWAHWVSERYGHRGAIIGVVDIVDAHWGSISERWDALEEHNAQCSTWAEPDAWHLVLAAPRPLAKPIPYRGALGLRTLPDEVASSVWAGLVYDYKTNYKE